MPPPAALSKVWSDGSGRPFHLRQGYGGPAVALAKAGRSALEAENILRRIPLQRVSRIDDQRKACRHRGVVERRMVRGYHGAIDSVHRALGNRSQTERPFIQGRHVRVAVTELRSAALQQLEDVEGRRLTHVADVPLVGDTEEMDSRPIDRLLP